MPKPQSIKLSVDSPCHQNWNNMQEAGPGRFCSECQKTVIDFTSWSDVALYQFFSKSSGNVCGRFLSTQLNKPISIPHQPHSKLYRLTIALGLTLICTQTPTMLAQNRPPKAQQSVIVADTIATDSTEGFGSISGTVIDHRKEPLISATVMVYQGGELKGGNVTDYDGHFTIKQLQPGTYDLLVTYYGYDSVMRTGILVEPGNEIVQKVRMIRQSVFNNNYVMGGSWSSPSRYWEPPIRELTAEIYGRVTDRHGNIVPHAEVQMYQDNILKAKRLANANGEYDITMIKPDTYDLRISAPGYEQLTIMRVDLQDGKIRKDAVMSHANNTGLIPTDEE